MLHSMLKDTYFASAASSVVSSSGMRTVNSGMTGASSLYSSPLAELASCLPPDLRHLLNTPGIADGAACGKQVSVLGLRCF
jgi:hypothetical protein